jgi:hypothetical protein
MCGISHVHSKAASELLIDARFREYIETARAIGGIEDVVDAMQRFVGATGNEAKREAAGVALRRHSESVDRQ